MDTNLLTINDEEAKIRHQVRNLKMARAYFPLASQKKVVDLKTWRQARSLETHAKEYLHVH